MILISGKPEDRINVLDRGFQYGDGVFETIAYRNGKAEFLEAHIQRLNLGCKRLAIPFHQHEQLEAELAQIIRELADSNAVIKIIVSRGVGGRGYRADESIIPSRIISTHPLPIYAKNHQQTGITARFCQQRLSENKSLSGIKHLNRLDQVMARNEWSDDAIAEGIMLDQHDHVIEGTMSNLFIVKSGKLLTAKLNTSGVAGIIRAEILNIADSTNILYEETVLVKEDIFNADEVFICNSIIGIWPVTQLVDANINSTYSLGKISKKLQELLEIKK